MQTKRLTTMAMLAAAAMIVFVIEAQIPAPIPIPGIKLGLANVITLFALWTLGRRDALLILLIRVVVGSLVIGAVMAMAYSLAGGFLCWAVMSLLRPLLTRKQVWVMSVFGAIGHNVGQLAVAVVITGTVSILVYAPVLILSGIATGFFTGQVAPVVLAHVDRLKH